MVSEYIDAVFWLADLAPPRGWSMSVDVHSDEDVDSGGVFLGLLVCGLPGVMMGRYFAGDSDYIAEVLDTVPLPPWGVERFILTYRDSVASFAGSGSFRDEAPQDPQKALEPTLTHCSP